MGVGWYWLNEKNEVCGPIDTTDLITRKIELYGWDDASREDMYARMPEGSWGGHGVRPCGWERVRYTELAEGCAVSTVFLGLDHGFSDIGPPIVFESMAFWGYDYMTPPADPSVLPEDVLWQAANEAYRKIWERRKDTPYRKEWDCERYAFWDQAEEGHWRMVAKMKLAIEEERAKMMQVWGEALSGVHTEE